MRQTKSVFFCVENEANQVYFLLCREWSKTKLFIFVQIFLWYICKSSRQIASPLHVEALPRLLSYEVSQLGTLNCCVNSALWLSDSISSLISTSGFIILESVVILVLNFAAWMNMISFATFFFSFVYQGLIFFTELNSAHGGNTIIYWILSPVTSLSLLLFQGRFGPPSMQIVSF